ncbi:mitogen-activated protein kinase kinase kinase 17-like [Lolium rigidum]|uniref:mitogen-activated protein kinase kinase kinase 17-like n=1 Tax=Lolium rigidum TaxID=89674 RepID=UPI001F5DBBD7|nr:mitogen-activated protein kinase kinase kinase 17-like [Lolium rigidum]
MAMAVSKQWTRVRTLGHGASGAEVFLAADDVSGELFAVKSVCTSGAAALMREQAMMAGLRSPRVVSCIGGRAGRDGSYQVFLEFAPGGSLADEVAKSGGLNEPTVRAYAADVARGLAYLHGEAMVHGDVKAMNVVIGADGRAKLADFGCSRKSSPGGKMIGGTPAFMAPEVARGEEQGSPADVWALGCTVLEMATGRAPWSGMDGAALAAMHRIAYTDAVPEVPQWLSAEAKDFLAGCFIRRASDRCTAAQLLEHPFLASAVADAKLKTVEGKWVSPKSTLDAALWETDSDSEEADDDELSHSTAERIKALACPAWALPDWDSNEGWIDVLSAAPTETQDAVAVPAEEATDLADAITSVRPTVEPEASDSDTVAVPAMEKTDLHSTITREEASGGAETVVPCIYAHRHQSLEDLDCQELLLLCFSVHIASVHKTRALYCTFVSLFILLLLPCIATRSISKFSGKNDRFVQVITTITPRRVVVTMMESKS